MTISRRRLLLHADQVREILMDVACQIANSNVVPVTRTLLESSARRTGEECVVRGLACLCNVQMLQNQEMTWNVSDDGCSWEKQAGYVDR
jgi:hypothetical protein